MSPRDPRRNAQHGLLLAALMLSSCGPRSESTCTDVGCSDSLDIEFDHDTWQTGEYKFGMVSDGETLSCRVELPSDDSGSLCTKESVVVELAGSDALSGLSFGGGQSPITVELTITLDGDELFSDTLTPEYTEVETEGEGCGPPCEQATETIAF